MKKYLCLMLSLVIIMMVVSPFHAEASAVNKTTQSVSSDLTFDLEVIVDYEDEHYADIHGIVRAMDGSGSVVWEYQTVPTHITAEMSHLSDLYLSENFVLVAADNTLYALDKKTGTVQWTAKDMGGGNSIAVDKYENVYINGLYGPNLVVLDQNGRELFRQNEPIYGWVNAFTINDNILTIEGSQTATMDISVFWPREVSVILDGKTLSFDQNPILVDGRTLVPLRKIFEELDATVSWDDPTQTVTATKGDTTISLTIGKPELYKNGTLIPLDVAPQLVGDRTLVPVRAVSEAFDCYVGWVDQTSTVLIRTEKMDLHDGFYDFMTNEFSVMDLTMQAMPYSSILNDTESLSSQQKILDYHFLDIDEDGVEELVISSEVLSTEYEMGGSCFSAWDYKDGGVTNIFAKTGMQARSAFRYFFVKYDGQVLLLESTGMSNSMGYNRYRNLYALRNGGIELVSKYVCNTYENIYTINEEVFSQEHLDTAIDTLDSTAEFLVNQKFPD